MSDISIFPDKASRPTEYDLAAQLGFSCSLWQQIHEMILNSYPGAIGEWNFPGKKYGWSYRFKDKKRAIIYFLPRQQYFNVAFVFGIKPWPEYRKAIYPRKSSIS